MLSISINVAFCTNCKGYCSATPSDKKLLNHPDIIDHFFYHGEPWFTLDHKTFERKTQFQDIEIKTMDLSVHKTDDHQYCHCKKTRKSAKSTPITQPSKVEYAQSASEMNEIESDLYFTDLYHTYYNFHAQNASMKHSGNSVRQF
jgi:hypothetical protein